MVVYFVDLCSRISLKVNADKSKVMVLDGKEGLECEVYVVGVWLEQVLEFKFLGYILDESSTDFAKWKKVVGAI